ncbi:MAG: c-type cytochrome [Myxococcales bacterium]|nr:c-type cytochrome [Myxococcales bacterium]MDD9969860.1 c-type cytochrome [Myxococcales bacterium]
MTEAKRRDDIQGDILHEYDGIEEADNALPKWWLGIFYGTMAFGIAYWFVYHEYAWAPTQNDVHAAHVAKLMEERAKPATDALTDLAGDTAAVTAGAETFKVNCVACHGTQGEGTIGPNLTDRFWIHGGGAASIHSLIRDGVAAKGMPSWGAILGPKKVREVTAFVLSLRNSNVEGKEPQGNEYQSDS